MSENITVTTRSSPPNDGGRSDCTSFSTRAGAR